MLDQCCNGDPCCGGGLGALLLQINIICVLVFLIAATAVVKHPDWLDDRPVVVQSVAEK